MPYPYHILSNELIPASAQDVETWIRHFLGKRLIQVERQNLDNTEKNFILHFKQRLLHVEGLDYLVWGGTELIEWSNRTTQIVRMWESTNESWRSIINDFDHAKLADEHFQWLEELSNSIKEKFATSSLKYEQPLESPSSTLKQMDSIVHNTLLVFKGFEVERLSEGSNIFYTVFANIEANKVLLGKYRVWERHDGGIRSGWMPSDNSDPKILELRDTIWQTIMSTATETIKGQAVSTGQSPNMIKTKGGRPRNADDDWAYEQVRTLGRDKQTVFVEWLERIGDRRTKLSNPQDSFNKAVSPKRGKGK